MKHLALIAALTLTLLVPAISAAADEVKIDAETKKAVARSLEFLKAHQKKDGSWGPNIAITAFSLLAFMSDGNLPNEGPYGPEVAKGIRSLIVSTMDDGYIAGNLTPNQGVVFGGGNNMYGHGMATLALSQAYGMSADDEVKKTLKKAVSLIVRAQNKEGGWHYSPDMPTADISVTIMQVMALRGAKDSGISVSDSVIKKAVGYIEKCHETDGGYRYMPQMPGSTFARTAAGVCVLQLAGNYDGKDVERAVDYMEKIEPLLGGGQQPVQRLPGQRALPGNRMMPMQPFMGGAHFWYGHYYAAHALHQVGGAKWEKYYSSIKKLLLETQKKSGEWVDAGYGPELPTAIAVLILNVPANYLPIYQR